MTSLRERLAPSGVVLRAAFDLTVTYTSRVERSFERGTEVARMFVQIVHAVDECVFRPTWAAVPV